MKTSFQVSALVLMCGFVSPAASATVRYVNLNSATPTSPYTNWSTAATVIQDAIDVAEPGDEIVVTNGVYETGGCAVHPGMTNRVAVTKALTVRSVNGPEVTVIRGRQVPGTTNGDGAVRCAYLTNGAVLVGFRLTDGATTLPPAGGGGVWCESTNASVFNCVLTRNNAYFAGGAYSGTLSNCVLFQNSATSRGGGAFFSRLVDSRVAENFAGGWAGGICYGSAQNCTLSSNRSGGFAGGCLDATLDNCFLLGNSTANYGGGSYRSILNNCLLTGNSAQSGGGAHGGVMNNCTIVGNSATLRGGGVSVGYGPFGNWCDSYACNDGPGCNPCAPKDSEMATLNSCIVADNYAPDGPNYQLPPVPGPGERVYVVLDHCATTPLPPNGMGNITNAPLFMDPTAGNFRLQSYSPCINAGLNAYAAAGPDLDGKPRIVAGTVDIGAYEFQSPQSMMSYAWLEQYGLPPAAYAWLEQHGSGGWPDFVDWDADGHDNWQEWQAGTDPTNSSSFLRMLSPVIEANGVVVSWESVSDRTYFLERSINLSAQVPFTPLATDIMGETGTTTYTDTNVINAGPRFYRVGMNVDFRPWPGAWDRSFSPDTSLYLGSVFALQPDGKIIVASSWFSPFEGTRVLRLNPDGSIDKTFLAVAVNDSVSKIALDQAGRVLVGGYISSVNGQLRDGIARLNTDGTVDTTFIPFEDIQRVETFVVQPDGRIVIRDLWEGLLRLNTDGSLDNGFVPEISTDNFAMANAADGKVLLTDGTNGTHAPLLWRLEANGQIDPTFHRAVFEASTGVYLAGIAVQPDGRIVVGGTFRTVDGRPRSGIVRLNVDGTVDLTFTPSAGRFYKCSALALDASGRVLINTYGDHLFLLKPNGEEDPDFHFIGKVDPVAYGFSAGWFCTEFGIGGVAIEPDGSFLLGGIAEFWYCPPPPQICWFDGDLPRRPFLGRLHGKSTPSH